MEQYSFAICPPPYIIGQVKDMKQQLRNALGKRFGSVNSDAHVTFNVFRCDARELESRIKAVQLFCGQVGSKEIRFDGYGNYPNGAFFLSPDKDSTIYIRYVMGVFHKMHAAFVSKKSEDPHMSIARQLSSDELRTAKALFSGVPDLVFDCDRISLRRFNRSRMQYDVVADFIFSGFRTEGEEQLSLEL